MASKLETRVAEKEINAPALVSNGKEQLVGDAGLELIRDNKETESLPSLGREEFEVSPEDAKNTQGTRTTDEINQVSHETGPNSHPKDQNVNNQSINRSRSVSSPVRPQTETRGLWRRKDNEEKTLLKRSSEYSSTSSKIYFKDSQDHFGSFSNQATPLITASSASRSHRVSSAGTATRNSIVTQNVLESLDRSKSKTTIERRQPYETPGANNSENLLLLLDNPTSTWKDFVDPERLALLSPKEIKRQTAIWELISTEKDYIRDLNLIKTVIEEPLLEKKILNPKIAEKIFLNAGALLHVNRDFLDKLEGRLFSQGVIEFIGDILINMGEKFLAYTLYCSNHNGATKQLQQTLKSNSAFKNFLEEIYKSNVMRSLDLNSYLLKPVQRICKYPLLIREVIKHTDPQSADYAALLEAQDKISAIMSIINEGARNNGDGTKKLIDIQNNFTEKLNFVTPNRYVVREDELFIMLGGAKKSRKVFLFNDLLIIARKDWRDKLHLIEKASLRDCRVCDVQSAESDSTFLFELIAESNSIQAWFFEVEIGQQEDESNNSRYLFVCPTQEVKKTWINCYKVLTQLKVKHKYINALHDTQDVVDHETLEEEETTIEVDPHQLNNKELQEMQKTIQSLENKIIRMKEAENELKGIIQGLEDEKKRQATNLGHELEKVRESLREAEQERSELQDTYVRVKTELEEQKETNDKKIRQLCELNQTIERLRQQVEDTERIWRKRVAQLLHEQKEQEADNRHKIAVLQESNERKDREINELRGLESTRIAEAQKLSHELATVRRERDELVHRERRISTYEEALKAEVIPPVTLLIYENKLRQMSEASQWHQERIKVLEKELDMKIAEVSEQKRENSAMSIEMNRIKADYAIQAEKKEREIDSMRQEGEWKSAKILHLEKKLEDTQEKLSDTTKALRLEKYEKEQLAQDLGILKTDIAALQSELDRTCRQRNEVSSVKSQLNAENEVLRLKVSQIQGRLEELSVSFNSRLAVMTSDRNNAEKRLIEATNEKRKIREMLLEYQNVLIADLKKHKKRLVLQRKIGRLSQRRLVVLHKKYRRLVEICKRRAVQVHVLKKELSTLKGTNARCEMQQISLLCLLDQIKDFQGVKQNLESTVRFLLAAIKARDEVIEQLELILVHEQKALVGMVS